MLSSVFLSGVLGDFVDENTRLVEVKRLLPEVNGKFKIDSFPVRVGYLAQNTFKKAKLGQEVVIKARLEKESDIGIYLFCEIFETRY